jgi:hypothetical protein
MVGRPIVITNGAGFMIDCHGGHWAKAMFAYTFVLAQKRTKPTHLEVLEYFVILFRQQKPPNCKFLAKMRP